MPVEMKRHSSWSIKSIRRWASISSLRTVWGCAWYIQSALVEITSQNGGNIMEYMGYVVTPYSCQYYLDQLWSWRRFCKHCEWNLLSLNHV
jgi:hypothetical protein